MENNYVLLVNQQTHSEETCVFCVSAVIERRKVGKIRKVIDNAKTVTNIDTIEEKIMCYVSKLLYFDKKT